jgi:O-antigen/teichoic acid export membrane protein
MSSDLALIRRRRLIWAILTSATSKAVAILAQLAVLPIALNSLGVNRYAAFVAIQAFLAWTSIFGFGLAPSLPKFIAAANAAGDRALQRDFVLSSLIIVGATALLLSAALILLGVIVPPWELISAGAGVGHRELWGAYVTAICLNGMMLVVVMQPSLRSGYQQLHYTNVWAIVSNVWIVAMLVYFRHSRIDIMGFNLIANGPIVPVLLLDLGLLMWQRPYLFEGRPDFRKVKDLIFHQSVNALVVQFSFMLFAFLPTFLVSRLTSPIETARFASVLQPMILGMNGMNLIFQPMVAAFADALSHHHYRWLKRHYWRFLALTLAMGLATFLTMALFGPTIFHIWLRRDIGIDRTLCIAFGAYFVFIISCSYHYYVLSAVGALAGVGKVFALLGAVAISIGAALALAYGAPGMVVGLCLGLAVAGLYYLPAKTLAFLGRMDTSEAIPEAASTWQPS